jgi:Putative polyhydroxyalkanoic acid system protein (PHA_gran_rgn)
MNALMPSLKLNFSHQLGQEEAVSRLKTLLTKVKDRYQDQVSNLHESWSGNKLDFGFKTYGFDISGNVLVGPNDVQLDGQIPFAAMMFKGKIENALRDQLTRTLA